MGLVALRFPTESGWVNVPFHASAPVSATSSDPARSPGESSYPVPDPTSTPGSTTTESSSCEKLQKAIRNGSEAGILAGMNTVVADETVDDTSHKVAKHYTGRDSANESARERDILILQDSCKS